jgi:hypothetical protein
MMKQPALDPDAAFPDEQRKPAAPDLKNILGRAYAPLGKVLDRLVAAHPEVASEWKYSPRSGWHLIYSRKQRRLFYLVPTHGNFRLSMILGGKAIAAVKCTLAMMRTSGKLICG